MKKQKEEEHVLVAITLDNDLYFKVLEIALKERKTIDQVVNEALRRYMELNPLPKKKRAKKSKHQLD